MSDDLNYRPRNQESDSLYNREPGIVIVPGSNAAKEYAKFEQFHSVYTAGTQPGNPYTYRPYPKMMYRAEHYKGAARCMATPPDPMEFRDEREYERAKEAADKFTAKCQIVVNSESERSHAMENGWREHPDEAVSYLLGRDSAKSESAARLNHEDRNLSGRALEERKAAERTAHASGEHLAEVPVAKIDGRSRAAREAKKAAQNT